MTNKSRVPILFCVALLLVACNTAQIPIKDSPPDERPQTRDYSEILDDLPADADRNRLAEQAEWLPRGIYIHRSGEFRPIPSNTNTRTSALAGRPSIKEQPARPFDTQPIVLPLPKEAY